MKANLGGNIRRLYVIASCVNALFVIPVIVPFFMENGLTLNEVFILQSAFSAWMMIWDVPAGYLSDCLGRRMTIIIGCIFGAVGVAVYAFSSTFSGFLLGEILWATMLALHSGTIEATLYETLQSLNRTDEYRHTQGMLGFYGLIVQAGASTVSGFLSVYSLRATVWATLIPFVIAFFVALGVVEPPRHAMQQHRSLGALWSVMKFVIVKQRILRYVSLITSLVLAMTLTLMWLSQPYQEAIGMHQMYFGAIHAAIMVSMAIASRLATPISKFTGERWFFGLVAITVASCYFILGFNPGYWGLVLLMAGRSCSGIIRPVMSDVVNRVADPNVRATVLSVRSFIERVIFTIGGLAVGYLTTVTTLGTVFCVTGAAGALALCVVFAFARDSWKTLPAAK